VCVCGGGGGGVGGFVGGFVREFTTDHTYTSNQPSSVSMLEFYFQQQQQGIRKPFAVSNHQQSESEEEEEEDEEESYEDEEGSIDSEDLSGMNSDDMGERLHSDEVVMLQQSMEEIEDVVKYVYSNIFLSRRILTHSIFFSL